MRYQGFLLLSLDLLLTVIAPVGGFILISHSFDPWLDRFNPAQVATPLQTVLLVGAHAVTFLIAFFVVEIVWIAGQLFLWTLWLECSSDAGIRKLPMVPEAVFRRLQRHSLGVASQH